MYFEENSLVSFKIERDCLFSLTKLEATAVLKILLQELLIRMRSTIGQRQYARHAYHMICVVFYVQHSQRHIAPYTTGSGAAPALVASEK